MFRIASKPNKIPIRTFSSPLTVLVGGDCSLRFSPNVLNGNSACLNKSRKSNDGFAADETSTTSDPDSGAARAPVFG